MRTHEKEVKKIINQFDFDCFIDCGVGYSGSESWSVRDFKSKCKIIGFEPQNERYELLKNNNYPGDLYKKALSENIGFIEGYMGNKDGKSDFWTYGNDSLVDDGLYKKERIEATTIDEVLEGLDVKNVFIWADIEGAELSMLKGGKKSLEKGIICGLNLELRNEIEKNADGSCIANDVIDFLKVYSIVNLDSIGSHVHKDILFKKNNKYELFNM